jgi:hypothetical protein
VLSLFACPSHRRTVPDRYNCGTPAGSVVNMTVGSQICSRRNTPVTDTKQGGLNFAA